MTRAEAEEYGYAVESYGGGFIVVDYSGKRGEFGAAYRGMGGEWRSQPVVQDPYPTEDAAWESIT